MRRLSHSAKLRKKWKAKGVQVPPIIIYSVTNRCNLKCRGCYAHSLHGFSDEEMDGQKMGSILKEAKDLGVSFFVLAGGEPFYRCDLLDVLAGYPEIIFLVFTNGLLLDHETRVRLRKLRHVIPLISLEGFEKETDLRRGQGVYARTLELMHLMKRQDLFFGNSLTLTQENFDILAGRDFVSTLFDQGSRFFLFLEYTPTESGTEYLVVSPTQTQTLMQRVEKYKKKWPALFITVPGDEQAVGGCLAAGRGFIHINARGDVEPCPFAPYSDANLYEISLTEALRSSFLNELRHKLPEWGSEQGGCLLWKNRKSVGKILDEHRFKSLSVIKKERNLAEITCVSD